LWNGFAYATDSYLSLIYDAQTAVSLSQQLKRAPMPEFKTKDIFRVSCLSLLRVSNIHVDNDRNLILAGYALAPLLFARDKANGKIVVADSYTACAWYMNSMRMPQFSAKLLE